VQGGFVLKKITDKGPFYEHPNTSLMLLNDALISSDGLFLSTKPARHNGKGGAFFRLPQRLTEGFALELIVEITPQSPSCHRWSGLASAESWCRMRGADGLALLFSKGTGAGGVPYLGEVPALGDNGAGMGYQGVRNSLALEFDVSHNHELGDPSGNHLSWQSSGPGRANTASHAGSLSHTSEIPYLSDGQEHRVRVRYDALLEPHHVHDPAFDFTSHKGSNLASSFLSEPGGGGGSTIDTQQGGRTYGVGKGGSEPGAMSVYIDDLTRPVLVTPVNLERVLGLAVNEKVWVGLTSASGEKYAQVRVSSFSLIDFTCPSDCHVRMCHARVVMYACVHELNSCVYI